MQGWRTIDFRPRLPSDVMLHVPVCMINFRQDHHLQAEEVGAHLQVPLIRESVAMKLLCCQRNPFIFSS